MSVQIDVCSLAWQEALCTANQVFSSMPATGTTNTYMVALCCCQLGGSCRGETHHICRQAHCCLALQPADVLASGFVFELQVVGVLG